MYFVYILKSIRNKRLYTGQTENLIKRIKKHNSGMSKYIKGNSPYELLYFEKYDTRSEAVRRERYLKTGKGREEIKKLINI